MFNVMRTPVKNRPARDRSMGPRQRRRIIVLSVLLHLLFLACWDGSILLDLSRLLNVAPLPQSAPLVFDLQPPEMPREVIATPPDARTTPDPRKADFLSDKNALARNQEPAPRLPLSDDPFSRGDFVSHDLPLRPPSLEREAAAPAADRPQAESEKSLENESGEPGSMPGAEPTVKRKTEPAAATRLPFQLDLPSIPHRQMDRRSAEEGGLSFNTYDWDFAPYMLALKERISRNIFPPLAFSKLGMIDGDTMLRFKIYPDGRLADLELLGYTGHRTLMETSRFAVTASAPFPGLPADFPKSYLEVTAKFSYFVKK
jgi:outer membrane biosynthesis protein TonB